MEIFVKYILPVLSILIVFVIPFIYVFLTGRFGVGVLLTWFLMIAWYTINDNTIYSVVV